MPFFKTEAGRVYGLWDGGTRGRRWRLGCTQQPYLRWTRVFRSGSSHTRWNIWFSSGFSDFKKKTQINDVIICLFPGSVHVFIFSQRSSPLSFCFWKESTWTKKGDVCFFTSPILLLFSVAMHSIPTVSRVWADEVLTISGAFDLLRLFLFTLTSSLRSQTESGD